MIARWIEQGQWARGPLCFSSSGGWELLMDPNWTHIYCARFSRSVTGMMMPQLERLTGWLCLPFWKVKPTLCFFFVFLLHPSICDLAFRAQMHNGLLGKSWCDKEDDADLSCCLSRSKTIFLAYERNMPGCVKQPVERENCALRCLSKSLKPSTKLLSLVSSGPNVSSHGRQASVRASREAIACLRLSRVLWP